MGLSKGTVGLLHAGTWVWWVESDRFLGDGIIADLFEIDRASLMKGVPIQTIRAAVHPDDLQALLSRAQESIDERSPYQTTFRVRRRDGHIRHVVSIGHCFFDEGRLVQFAGSTIEIAAQSPFAPSWDHLTEQVLAARETASVLGDPLPIQLLDMVLTDIGRTTANALGPFVPPHNSH